MTPIDKLIKKIQKKTFEINKLDERHFNTLSRSVKMQLTKQINRAKQEKTAIRAEITKLEEYESIIISLNSIKQTIKDIQKKLDNQNNQNIADALWPSLKSFRQTKYLINNEIVLQNNKDSK